ncbi:MAG: hypothetical protein CL868_16130 [Cytophagaceae bacterium]|nr:hypothetical protein [Cytophagaceae bacterium]
MKKIYSRVNMRRFWAMMVFGFLYFIIGVLSWIFEESSGFLLNTFYIPFGLFYMGYYYYLFKNNKLRSMIAWDGEKIMLQTMNHKPITFTHAKIKTLTITSNNLIVNAGRGDGEIIEIKDFTKSDIQLLHTTFEDFTTQNLAIA